MRTACPKCKMNVVDNSSNTVRRCESISAVKNVDSVENNRNLADFTLIIPYTNCKLLRSIYEIWINFPLTRTAFPNSKSRLLCIFHRGILILWRINAYDVEHPLNIIILIQPTTWRADCIRTFAIINGSLANRAWLVSRWLPIDPWHSRKASHLMSSLPAYWNLSRVFSSKFIGARADVIYFRIRDTEEISDFPDGSVGSRIDRRRLKTIRLFRGAYRDLMRSGKL